MESDCSLWGMNWILKYYLDEGFISHEICKFSIYAKGPQIFQKSGSHLQILGTRRVTW
jgi:hypothetical protein